MTRWPGFLLRDCRWLFLGPRMLSWMPIRSRHCCGAPGRVLVWISLDRHSSDGYKSCRGLRIPSQALLCNLTCFRRRVLVRALRSPLRFSLSSLSSNTATINKLIRPRGGQGIQAWTLRTCVPTMPGRSTSDCHQPGKHCLHHMRSAVRCWANRMKGGPHSTKNR